MIELSNTSAQTLSPGQTLTFDTVLLKSGCAEAHRTNSGTVTLRADAATYEVHFSANVAGTVGTGFLQLAISLDGDILTETTMLSTPGDATSFNNVATATLIRTGCGCCGKVAVVNTGTTNVVVGANPAFFVKRVA